MRPGSPPLPPVSIFSVSRFHCRNFKSTFNVFYVFMFKLGADHEHSDVTCNILLEAKDETAPVQSYMM